MGALAWVGARAQWVLAIGVVAALVLPGPGALLAETLAFWVAFLFGLAMTRIDLHAVLRRAVAPRRLVSNLGFCAVLMIATPAVLWMLSGMIGLPQSHISALVYTTGGPPLGSAAAFCLILGLDAAFALELTVLGSFIAPITLPVISRALLGEAVPIDALEMTLRLATLIGGATVGAVIARRVLGGGWIDGNAKAFDGLAAVALLLFLFPLFRGVPALIAEMPGFALATLSLAVAANLGVQILSVPVLARVLPAGSAGAGALVWGNRNAALSLASLPPDPLFTLYVALYQFPMYFTPLVMRPVFRRVLPGAVR